MKNAFLKFADRETSTWAACGNNIPRRELLVRVSGSLQSPIAHHVHQPSSTTPLMARHAFTGVCWESPLSRLSFPDLQIACAAIAKLFHGHSMSRKFVIVMINKDIS